MDGHTKTQTRQKVLDQNAIHVFADVSCNLQVYEYARNCMLQVCGTFAGGLTSMSSCILYIHLHVNLIAMVLHTPFCEETIINSQKKIFRIWEAENR